MKFNLWKTLGLAKPLVQLLKSPLVKPLASEAINILIEEHKPALKNGVAGVIGSLPSGTLADGIKADAAEAAGQFIDNFQVTL